MATLANGLTLVVHEDRSNPLIATQVLYDVGSKDEPPGRTGFAHLFEHLMFKPTPRRPGDWHDVLREIGGQSVNGTTGHDRTNYYQVVPTSAIDRLLWLESDRMGNLLGCIDEQVLADELSVIKNEKREHEGAPLGTVSEAVARLLYPVGHPYAHSIIGSYEDLDRADTVAVEDWYRRWYGAANATLLIGGDIGFDEALEKVERYFGDLPPGPPVQRIARWVPDVGETRRLSVRDRVPERNLQIVYVGPPEGELDSVLLHVVCAIFSYGTHSRLTQRLVEKERLCLSFQVQPHARKLCGEIHVYAVLAPGADPAAVERIVYEEFARLIERGPSVEEVRHVNRSAGKTMSQIGDNFATAVGLLAHSMTVYGRPDGYVEHLELSARASVDDLREVAERWLMRPAIVCDVQPFTAVAAQGNRPTRGEAPPVGKTMLPAFPTIERITLSNGLEVRFARRPGTRSIETALHLRGGADRDPAGLEGVTGFALNGLNAGTQGRARHEMEQIRAATGLNFGVSLARRIVSLSMSGPRDETQAVFGLLAEIFLKPSYPADDMARMTENALLGLLNRGQSATAAASIASPTLVYGRDHLNGRPISGTRETVAAITREAVLARYRQWLDPAMATLVVVGDLEPDALRAMLEKAFGGWTRGGTPGDAAPSIWMPSPGRFAIPRPGAEQTALSIGLASPEIRHGDAAAMIFNNVFGGSFGSRLNANLRVRRGWTYGINSAFVTSPVLGAFSITGQVEGARTLNAMAEIESELRTLVTDRPITADEIEAARNAIFLEMSGDYVTNAAVLAAMLEQINFDLPDGWFDGVGDRLAAVTTADVAGVAAIVADPGRFSWIAAGAPEHLGSGGLTVIDEDGERR